MRHIQSILLAAVLLFLSAGTAAAQGESPNQSKGFAADKVYSLGSIDQINVYNGNLMVTLPLGQQYPVSPQLQYGFTLMYNSKVWENEPVLVAPDQRRGWPSGDKSTNAGLGWRLSFGRLSGNSDAIWYYESPDGALHQLYSTPHLGGEPVDDDVWYTRDGSYLRVRKIDFNHAEVDFPNGVTHVFEPDANDKWRIKKMFDRFRKADNTPANWVTFTYANSSPTCPSATDKVWQIQDSHARQHEVCLANESFDGDDVLTIQQVNLAAFTGKATYKLHYVQQTTARGCWGTYVDPDRPNQSLPVLLSFTLPDQSQYLFGYHAQSTIGDINGIPVTNCDQGTLREVILPTGGSYEWQYETVGIPSGTACGDFEAWAAKSTGVRVKLQKDENGNEVARWEYRRMLSDQPPESYQCMDGIDPTGGSGIPANEELQVHVISPSKDKTIHYFSVWPGQDENAIPSPAGFLPKDHGLPFTRFQPPVDGRFLSTEIFDCDDGGTCPEIPVRRTYVLYEQDDVANQHDSNRRVKAERTVFVDDANKYRDVENDDFDGWGHYRRSTVSGSFGPTRTTYTNTNPGSDPWGRKAGITPYQAYFLENDPFLTGKATESWVEEGTQKARTLVCHDPLTGFLKGRRTLENASVDQGAHDVVVLYDPDTEGNVEQEDWYGGDTQDVSGITHLCAPAPAGSQYRTTYTYDNGGMTSSSVRKKDGAREVFLTPLRQTINLNTGLVATSTDPSDLVTAYTYDAMSRLKTVTSPGSATVSYDYKRAGEPGYPRAAVLINLDSADSENDNQQRVDYDVFGRVIQETKELPDGRTGVRSTEYDSSGRKQRVSMWEDVPTHFTTFSYDVFGRVKLITTPDGKFSSYKYIGERTSTKSAQIGTIWTAGGVTESHVAVTEVRDIHGRLTSVMEGRAATLDGNKAISTLGAAVATTDYTYDIGGRMKSVRMSGKDMTDATRVQPRDFEYDLRGFLTKETHPESGVTDYREFDAKGHARYIDQGATRDIFDLEFVYDAAERQTEIKSRAALNSSSYRTQKSFDFDSTNLHGKSAGKLAVARRHNYTSLGDVVVSETFHYGDAAGRLTNKKTKIENVTTGAVLQEVEQSAEYNDLGLQKTITYPNCLLTTCGSPAWPSITQTFAKGYLKSVSGFIDNITYHENGLYDTITHAGTVPVKDIQEADGDGLPRPRSIRVEGGVACPVPTITAQPQSKTIPHNTSTRLTVTAENAEHYQWYRGLVGDKTTKVGLDQNFFDTPGITGTTHFWVEITNSCGYVRSVAARVDVITCGTGTFSLTVSPANVTDNESFTLTAPSIPNTTYQWFRGTHASNTSLGTTTTNTFTINGGITASTQYFVKMSDPVCNVTPVQSQVLTVTPCTKPLAREIHSVASGSSVTLRVDDLGDGATFQWYEGSSYSDLSKPLGSGSSITVTPTTPKSYWVRMSRTCGTITTTADTPIITVNVACATSIFVQPAPVTKPMPAPGSGVALSTTVVPGGTGPFTYQWYQVGTGGSSTPISGATGATYTWNFNILAGSPVPLAAQRVVFVRVKACGVEVESDHVMLSVVKTPQRIYAFSSGQTLYGAYAAKLYVYMDPEPSGEHVYDYEWYMADGTPSGRKLSATGREINVSKGVYWVKITGQHNTVPDAQGNIYTYYEETLSPRAYVTNYGDCELPPLEISQSVATIVSGTQNVIFRAFCDHPDVTFQWYEGQSGDTRKAVSADSGQPDQLTVGSSSVRPYWVRASLACGAHADSATLVFTSGPCGPVLIDQNIASRNVAYGDSTSLTVTPINVPRPSYTWYRGEGQTNVAGTGTTLSLANVTESGRYWVQVRNLDCSNSADSFMATVRVASCPSISPPSWQTEVWTDRNTARTLNAQSGGATGYQWYEGEVGDTSKMIGGQTLATFTTPALTAEKKYWVRVFGSGCIVDSPTITVKVCDPPHFTSSPHLNYSIVPNQTTVLGVDAAGTNLSYQWYAGLTGNTAQPIGGETDRILLRPNQTSEYWVRVTGRCGPGGNDVRHLDSPTFTISVCPVLEAPTATLTKVMPWTTTQISINASGTRLTYQWYVGATPNTATAIPGATGSTLTTPPITGTTSFFCMVTSGNCSRQSEEITIFLCDRPLINWTIGDKYIKKGEQVFFYVNAIGTEEESALITFYAGNAGDVAGSTIVHGPSPYNFSRVVNETTKYWARATLGNCYADTPNITVTVCIPRISTQPAGGNITTGQSKTLTVATDIPAAGYQWYAGDTGDTSKPIAGATGASVTVAPTADTKYWVRVLGCGSSSEDSAAALVTVCIPPSIRMHPYPSQWRFPNQSTQLHVDATGTNLTYTWYRGAAGDTTSPISTQPSIFVSPTATTSYWVRASNGCGQADSNVAVINVCATPEITQQPLSQNIFSGKTATLSVTATQATATPMTYQWYRGTTEANSTAIAGATSPSYTTPALTAETSYWVRITAGGCSADSNVATVSMCAYSEVINAPDDRDISLGQTARLQLTISPVPQSYTWFRGAQGVRTAPIGSYSFVDVSPTTTTQYWGELTYQGCAAKTRTITVYVSIPTITSHPASVQVNNGQTTTLTVAADIPGVTYQWYQGTSGSGTLLAGATNASFTTPAMTTATSYWVKVTGPRGHAVNSNTANVTVCAPAAITGQPPSRSIQKGQQTTLTVTATGTNLRYQWYYGTSGSTTSPAPSTSSFITVSPNVPTSYWVKVTGDCGTVNSATATVTVCAIPVITQQPASQPVFSGRTATLTAAATQETGIPVSYQWYSGTSGSGTPIAGATSPTYTTPALTAEANYWVRITSGVCSVDSNTATVSICAYPEVINGPDDRDIALGQTVRLSLTLSPVPQSGQWFRGTQGVRTSPISSYTFADVSPTTTTQYWGELVYGGCAAKTRTVTVYVSIPTITSHPASVQVNHNQSTTLSVAANTTGLTYQWYSGTSGSGTPIAGATSPSYTTPPMTTAANYWVKVTGSRGHAVNSNTATVTVCAPAAITQQPAHRSISKGNQVILTVAATGTNLRYQWYYGTSGSTASPAPSTSDYITVSPNVPTSYWVRVTSDCGVVNSNTATVSVCATPVITQQPLSQPIFSGKTATLSVTATQETGLPITYQWYQGTSGTGTPIAGATSSTYTTPALTADTNYWVQVTSGVCQTNSDTATVSMCFYPEIINAPADRDIAVGQTVRLSLTLSPSPQSGRWYRGAQGDRTYPISSYTFADVSPTVTTQYWGELTYGGCTAKTRTVTVFVSIPTITQQPANTQVNGGTSATLSVVANTTGLTYQWYSGTSGAGTPISGATGASYVTPALGVGSTASYWVKVTGSRGHVVNSNTATVTWCNPATITQQPVSRSIRRGYSTTIYMNATGTNIRYQWYYGVSGNTTYAAPSQTSYITVSPSNPQQYWVRVTSDCGYADSVTVNVDVCVDPTIDVQPLSQSIFSGTSATLSVTATAGTAVPLTYQWYQGASGTGTPIAGATSATYTTPALTTTTDYWVLVQSGACYAYSETATVDMCYYGPTVNTPDDRFVEYQQQTLIRVVISPVPMAYRWYEGVQGDRSRLISTASSFYMYPTATKNYWGEFEYNGCWTKSRTFKVDVCVPTILTNPASVNVPRNSSTTLSVSARAGATYQWYIGTSPGFGTPISGATGASYTTPAMTSTTSYWVKVTGTCTFSKNSSVATVTVY